ncbi:hypothetical protein PUMCH_002859 [Australozyma saopauloensis]|uniref:DNA primase n=1 Tax=Australozyma saopauloensis TaxID=291208 RepID=A0AAX4HB03_9ASCO|nr:hypothetical protein PUMCH_002859 [[Candida] saopauloensis]
MTAEDPTMRSFNADSQLLSDTDRNASMHTSSKLYKPLSSDMLFYYERLLPFKQIFRWLSHSPKATREFTMREFAYEFRSGAYQRYNSFASVDEFKKSVVAANPTRFEVGAVYAVNPKERKNLPKSAMKPLQKELVFDIDLTDYDEIRTCCLKTDICKKCWRFIQVAAEIITAALREDFGFEHFIWVFSGRRGAHCWVSDSRARLLDELARKSIVEYMDVLSGRMLKMGRTSLGIKKPYHPHIERSFDVLKDKFSEIILEEQNPWATSAGSDTNWDHVDTLLSFLPDQGLRQALKSKWQDQASYSSSKQKWDDLTSVGQKVLKHQSQAVQLTDAKKEIIIYYMYPRLDVEVSKQMIHLLKSPFCIHPGTGNVCVPFDPFRNLSSDMEDDAYGFNPVNAPNLSQLQTEIDTWDANSAYKAPSESSESEAISDYAKSSLKPYVDYFSTYVSSIIKDELTGSNKRAQDLMDF